MLLNTFTGPLRSPYAALDTETHTYVDGAIKSRDEIEKMMLATDPETGEALYPVAWWRQHTRVEVWAFIVWTPEGCAILETYGEFCRFAAAYGLRTCWWYYAPFDFSALDALKLCGGWEYVEEKPRLPYQYSELASPFGARYNMTEIYPVDPENTFTKRTKRKTRKVTHYDLFNLIKGGLDELLKSFDVRDENGEPVRKDDKIDYQAEGAETLTERGLHYMIGDARGLWYLVDAFGRRLYDNYQIEIRGTRPEVTTASGLAKKLLLRKMYPHAHTDRGRLTMYRKTHPITPALDSYARRGRLLLGGLVMLNPRVRGKQIKGAHIWRYDYNNRYGATLAEMGDIRGSPHIYEGRVAKPQDWESERIFEITELHAVLRPGMIASWIDPVLHEVSSEVTFHGEHDGYMLIFDYELEELENWYMIDALTISRTIIFAAPPCPAFGEFVNEHYDKKAEYKEAGDMAASEIEKLTNNGATGKFSQNPNTHKQKRALGDDGVVRLVIGELDPDEKMIMNIFQGAAIMAHSRVALRKKCRAIAFQSGHTVAEVILYTDTDSIHTTHLYTGPDVDRRRLGALKIENVHNGEPDPIVDAIFTAPKTYAEITEHGEAAFHCKGVRKKALMDAWEAGESLADVYRVGREYLSDAAINVQGGKAILPFKKAVCRKLRGEISDDEIYY